MLTKTLFALTSLAAGALADTPPGTSPSVPAPLNVQYGSSSVTPPGVLLPLPAVVSAPKVSSNTKYNGTYMLFLIDLDIKFSQVIPDASNTSALNSLTPGYGPQRTTRLHWWQTNLQQAADGSFVQINSSVAKLGPALYDNPKPPQGDMPHTYTFYLFQQTPNFTLPANVAAGDFNATSAKPRLNFSLAETISKVGQPKAATYFIAQNTSASPSATGSGAGGAKSTNAPIATAAGERLTIGSTVAGLGALAFAILM